jgi:L-lactate dehydrogenase complex protein LldG
MSAATASRSTILDRVRAACNSGAGRDEAYAALPRNHIRKGALDPEARLNLLSERLHEYDAKVVECAPGDLASTIAHELGQSGRRSFVAPAGLRREWLAAGFDWKIDGGLAGGLDAGEIEKAEGVVTAAFCAVADSGTIVLHHSASEGRRLITLLPDWHLCILFASQVVETLPEYFSRCVQPPRLATWISGPSATADIEMTRIKGVHGPRFLVVILARDET